MHPALEVAAELGAASADHLMFCSESGMKAMAAADVTPVLLPGTTLFLGMRDWAPARRMIEAGCRVALATDFNPGSCPCVDPLTILRLGCLQLRMTFEEAFTAMTLHAARSLGRKELGHLHPGARAEVLLWELMENSKKFHPSSEPEVTVDIIQSTSQTIAIRVSDNGMALSHKQSAPALRPYYQGEKDFTGEAPGMGLGLWRMSSREQPW